MNRSDPYHGVHSTAAPVTIVSRTPIDPGAIIVGVSIETGAAQIEAESNSRRIDIGIGTVGYCGNDGRRGGDRPLHICGGGCLSVALLF
jgi:hypothetical protein